MKEVKKYILSQIAKGNLSAVQGKNLLDEIQQNHQNNVGTEKIAVIGMAGRYPDANDLNKFWGKLRRGESFIRDFPQSRIADLKTFIGDEKKRFHKGGYFEDISKFDADFFNILPKEAQFMDPHHRILLEVVWEAIEDAGYTQEALSDAVTGVFVGEFKNQYSQLMNRFDPMMLTGNIQAIASGRISYFFNLRGPNMMIDTTCSSSLVAVYNACQTIRANECEYAIAAGINLNILPFYNEDMSKISIESPDGCIRTFDKDANGTIGGEGAGVLILKKLDKALKDGDNIRAIIRGGAINHDGRSNGITSPNSKAQAEVIYKALKNTKSDAREISYIEAHGTGTKLGDPIEIEGLTKAFSRLTKQKQYFPIGSVKTNIGHLDTAAGITGIIKVILSLENKEIAPSINFKIPNPLIPFEKSPVFVNEELRKWDSEENGKRVAGISSFGLSGTNVHMIIEEASDSKASRVESESHLVVFSAPNKEILCNILENYEEFLKKYPDTSLQNLAWTCIVGRKKSKVRLAIVASSIQELIEKIVLVMNGIEENNEDRECFTNLTKCKEVSNDSGASKLVKAALAFVNEENIDLAELYKECKPKRISLPTYPFQHKRYWLDSEYMKENEEYIKEEIKEQESFNKDTEYNLTGREDGKYSDMEKAIASIWNKELDITTVNIHDDFFEIGGDSISAICISSAIKNKFGIEIEMENLYSYPTIYKLAEYISESNEVVKNADVIEPTNKAELVEPSRIIDEVFELSNMQKSIWISQVLDPNNAAYNIPINIMIYGHIDEDKVEEAIRILIDRHDSLRTKFVVDEGEPKQVVCAHTEFYVEKYDLSCYENEEQNFQLESLLEHDMSKIIALEDSPLMRVKLIKCKENEYCFYINMHHIISDSWSCGILFKEFVKAYTVLCEDKLPELPPIKYRYKDYVSLENEKLKNGYFREHEEFWERKLQHIPEILRLPYNENLLNKNKYLGNECHKFLDKNLSEALKKFGKKYGMSLNMVMLSAYFMTLHMISESDDIIVGTSVAGRNYRQIEDLIGVFVNTIPIRVDFNTIESYEDLLNLIKKTCLESYRYQEYPIDLIVDKVNSKRREKSNSIFNVTFVFLNAPMKVNYQELNFEPKLIINNTYKFDITLFAQEANEVILYNWRYRQDLFSKEQIEDFTERYEMVLEKFVELMD